MAAYIYISGDVHVGLVSMGDTHKEKSPSTRLVPRRSCSDGH